MASNGSAVAGHDYIQDFGSNEPGLINPGVNRVDTLPRVRVKPVGGAVRKRINDDTGRRLDESLLDVYDPDAIGRSFYHPVEEIAPLISHVPVSSKREGWYDPPRPHRVQIVKGWKNGKPVLQEHYIATAAKLKALSESDKYKRSRYYESTGAWEKPETGKYDRFVEAFNPAHQSRPVDQHALDSRTMTLLREADERFIKQARDAGKTGSVTLPSGRTARRESAVDPFSYDTITGATSVTANIDQEFVPITGGPFFRNLTLYAHWEQTAKAFEQKNHSELAKACINVTTDFVLGRGVTWKIRNEKVEAVWREFWTRNRMDQRLRVLSDDRTWQGGLIIHKNEILKGFLQIRSIDPGAFWEQVTSPDDIEQILYWYASYPMPTQIPYSKVGAPQLKIPSSKYIVEQYPASEIYHIKGNVSSSEKWERSDFYASLGTLKRHRDWVNAVTLRDMLQANLVWIITINGDDADVQTFLNDQNNAQLPAFGGTWIQNQALKLEAAHQDVASGGGRMGQGTTGQFLTALFATGQQMPSAYFNLQGEGAARATALVQGEPFAKKIDNRQQEFSALLDHLYTEVMERAVRAGRIDAQLLRSDDADPEWIWPIIFEEDRNAKLTGLTTARGMAVISHRTYATQTAAEFSLKEYQYEEEMAQIKREAQDPILKLWPPINGGTQAVTAPPLPTAPVPAAGAPAPTSPGAPVPAQPQSTHERLAGADERADFRDQQGEHQQEVSRLSESDQEFLEHEIESGSTGVVKLPSGLTAIIHESNPNHAPAGSPEGGQFTSGDGGTAKKDSYPIDKAQAVGHTTGMGEKPMATARIELSDDPAPGTFAEPFNPNELRLADGTLLVDGTDGSLKAGPGVRLLRGKVWRSGDGRIVYTPGKTGKLVFEITK